jgi:hypothetical protein
MAVMYRDFVLKKVDRCVTGMPTTPYLYAEDLIETFKKMHEAKRYKEMVGVSIFLLNLCSFPCQQILERISSLSLYRRLNVMIRDSVTEC